MRHSSGGPRPYFWVPMAGRMPWEDLSVSLQAGCGDRTLRGRVATGTMASRQMGSMTNAALVLVVVPSAAVVPMLRAQAVSL